MLRSFKVRYEKGGISNNGKWIAEHKSENSKAEGDDSMKTDQMNEEESNAASAENTK